MTGGPTGYSPNYINATGWKSKRLNVVVVIPGVDILSTGPINSSLVYGGGAHYGDHGIFYGGTGVVRDILSLDKSTLTLSQRLEPEQGRGSVSTLTLAFVDQDGYMSKVCAPGVIIPDLLGASVSVFLGYLDQQFPQDYTQIFKGRVTEYETQSGMCSIQISDPNVIRRQNVFQTATTTLIADMGTDASPLFQVLDLKNFSIPVIGPNGIYDPAIMTVIQIDNEYILVGQTGYHPDALPRPQIQTYSVAPYGRNATPYVLPNTGIPGTPAAPGTPGALYRGFAFGRVLPGPNPTHAAGATVTQILQIQDVGIDMALKIMMSGFVDNSTPSLPKAAPYASSVPAPTFVAPNQIILDPSIDAILTLGLTADTGTGANTGDYVTITGAANPGNNGTLLRLTVIGSANGGNNNVLSFNTGSFVNETGSAAVMALFSQFNTYPDIAGVGLPSYEVDVARHLYIKDTFDITQQLLFSLSAAEAAKTFIESQIYLALGCYSLTRFGLCSMGITLPPLASTELVTLDSSNILEPQNIRPLRAINQRKFWNEVTYSFDYDPILQLYISELIFIDANSISTIGVTQTLPITSNGSKSFLAGNVAANRISSFLLNRYKAGAIMMDLKVSWAAAGLIESGDVVALNDPGDLHITNFKTGQRFLGTQLFEVINRTLDLRNGNAMLTLISEIGNSNDRFAGIAPSSLTVFAGSNPRNVTIKDSYGSIFPGAEWRKWINAVGLNIVIHSPDWTYQETRTLRGLNPSNQYILELDLPLSGTPPDNYIVEVDFYPTSTDPNFEAYYKATDCYLDPSPSIATGISTTQFTVSGGDVAKFQVGFQVIVRRNQNAVNQTLPPLLVADIDFYSQEVTVQSIVGTTITVSAPLVNQEDPALATFTPNSNFVCELLGFADGGAPYRII